MSETAEVNNKCEKLENSSESLPTEKEGFFKIVSCDMLVSWKFGNVHECAICKTKLSERAM